MKFQGAAPVQGFANCLQEGTEPSAKSIQTGFVAGSVQGSLVAASGAPGRAETVRPATASSRNASVTLFTRADTSSKKAGARLAPRSDLYVRLGLALVERS